MPIVIFYPHLKISGEGIFRVETLGHKYNRSINNPQQISKFGHRLGTAGLRISRLPISRISGFWRYLHARVISGS